MKKKVGLLSTLTLWVFNLLLLLAFGLFTAGAFAPLMELERLWFFRNQFSLVTGLRGLLLQQEVLMFIILFLFSVVTPLVKISALALIANTPKAYQYRHRIWLGILETWGKWSMLDVFVVALLFVAVKLGALAQVKLHYGIYLFAGAVLLMQLLSVWLHYSVRDS